MSVKLVLLGMLKHEPMHGYELKARIEQEMGDWTSIAFGSIYFALKKLTEEGFVEQAGHEQHGNRPSRIIYRITKKGENEFYNLLVKTWTGHDRQYFPLDIGLYFLNELDTEKRLELVRNRIMEAEYVLKNLRLHQSTEMKNPYIPPIANSIFTHSLYHLEAERDWLREVEMNLTEGKY